LRGILDEFQITIVISNFFPKHIDLTIHLRRVETNIVEYDHPAFGNQRSVVFEISFNSFISVISINKQKVNFSVSKSLLSGLVFADSNFTIVTTG